MSLLDELLDGSLDTDVQGASWLFKLLAEVRQEIYHLIYPEHLLHIKPGPDDKDNKWPFAYRAFWYAKVVMSSVAND